jgi:succinyl-CoA synthetase beta subunit
MPSFGSPKNPVDITGGSGAQGYVDSISVAMNSDWVSAIAILYCETALTKPMDIATAIVAGVKRSGSASAKPIVAVFVGGKLCIEAGKYLVDNSIPMYNNPKKAMCALSSLRQYSKFKQRGTSDHFVPFADAAAGKAKALEIINAARADGRTVLLEYESKALLSAYGLPVVTSRLARSEDEAVSIGKAIGFPLVMKIVSPQILHKSEAGGVKVNVKDEEGVRAAYRQILENARKYNSDAMIYGVLIQEMAPQGKEVIIGSVNDSTFGPTVMFGLGGIFVEVLKDVTFRVAPFSQTTALEMVPEIKSFPILAGARGEKPRDVRAIAEIASRVSQMVHELGEEVLETDANPCIVYEEGQGVKIVDARVILSGKPLRTGQRLGKGRYKLVQKVSGPRNASQVWKARDTETKEDVALKFYKDREQCKEQYKRLAAAGDRLGVKLSPHLGGPGNTAVMVMEYGRPLDQILSSEKNSWKWKKLLLHGAAVAVAKGLHAQGLVWTDVKAQNFVVTGELGFEYSVKLIDLESCCKVGDPVEPGSPLYSSLEQLSGKPAAITMDTWSFAIMTLQAHLGAHPYTRIPQVAALLTEVANERANESELKGKILEALKDPGLAKILLPDTLTPPERQFLTLCLEQDPEHRVQLDNVKEEILRDSGSAGSTAMDDKMAVMPWAGLKWIHTLKFVNDPKCPFLKTCRLDMKPAFPTGIQVADLVDPKMQDALAGVLGKAGAQSAAEVGKFLKQHLHGESFRGAIHSIDFVWNEFAAANLVFTKLPLLNGAFSRIPQTHNWENPNGIYQLPIDNPLIEKDEAPECNNMNTGHSDTQALFIAARRKVNAAWRALTGSKPWAEQLAKHFPNVSLVPVVRASNPNFVITNACYGFPNINTRDPGYFGKGHYFTTYMDYAAKYKSEGTALRSEVFFVGLVATACVFPVVEDPFSPTNTLMGKAQVNSYDSHYVLVNKMIQSPDTFVPMSPLPLPQPVVHADIQKDEIVTFESQHVIPLFLLHYFI